MREEPGPSAHASRAYKNLQTHGRKSAPAPFVAQLSVPPVPDRGTPARMLAARRKALPRATDQSRDSHVQMQARLPSESASTQKAGALESSTKVPPASIAARIRSWATSCGTLTSRCQR
jgi:hypothetical protein